jgi:arginyl-tRNA synthetase
MVKELVEKVICKKIGVSNVTLLTPKHSQFGDYSLNTHSIQNKKITAKDLDDPLFEKIEEVHGFINFYLSKTFLFKELNSILEKKENYISTNLYKNTKCIVEYTDPNPFKEFHIGHLFSNIIGESLARLYEAGGAEVKRANYQGDVGMHVAKSVWGMQKLEKDTPPESASLPEKARFLGKAYAYGAQQFEVNDQVKEEIKMVNKKIYDNDPSLMPLYIKGRTWSLEYFETIYTMLGTKFDLYYFESEIGKIGLSFVKEYLEKGVFEKSDGAIIFPGEKYGLHTRVFINSLGLPTYEAKELGLAPTKYKDFPYDRSIIITGNEIDAYFKVLLCALEKINPDLAQKTTHLSHGMVRNADGSKMSSRSGNVMTGELLIQETKQAVLEIIGTGKESYTEEEKQSTAETVAISAIKYAFLKTSIGKDIAFDLKKSIAFTGDSGPYIQYTYARCRSILTKIDSYKAPVITDITKEEEALLKHLIKYSDIVIEAIKTHSPHIICTYLYNLTSLFNIVYEANPILKAEEQEKNIRLALVEATSILLKSGLYLLGIRVLERI